jgi:hypothetical protein
MVRNARAPGRPQFRVAAAAVAAGRQEEPYRMIVHCIPHAARLGVAAALLGLLGGCGSMPQSLWPFGKQGPQPVERADEIEFDRILSGPAGPALPQYWQRNALVVDLQGAGGSGELRMRPKSPQGWPVRLAFRVVPGAFDRLEIVADQRVVWPIDGGATAPVELELPPGVYRAATPEILVRWGPGPLTPGGAPPIMIPGGATAPPAASDTAAATPAQSLPGS